MTDTRKRLLSLTFRLALFGSLLYFIADGSTAAIVAIAVYLYICNELSGTALRLQAEQIDIHHKNILTLANASMGAHKEKPNGINRVTSH